MRNVAAQARKWLYNKRMDGKKENISRQLAGGASSGKRLHQTKTLGLLCAAGAVILLLLAFTGGESGAGGEWVPLNEALQAKLDGAEDSAIWKKGGSSPKETATALNDGGDNEVNGSKTPENTVQPGVTAEAQIEDIDGSHAGGGGDADGTVSGGTGGDRAENGNNGGSINDTGSQTDSADNPTGTTSGGTAGTAAANEGKLDINRATAAQLETLKGIGPSKAAAIVRDRELNGFFLSVDDLLRVKGIGEKLLSGLKESVVANR
ncbi:ComEA family DNA-binding protein [Paenibacillus sp. CAU 1782]